MFAEPGFRLEPQTEPLQQITRILTCQGYRDALPPGGISLITDLHKFGNNIVIGAEFTVENRIVRRCGIEHIVFGSAIHEIYESFYVGGCRHLPLQYRDRLACRRLQKVEWCCGHRERQYDVGTNDLFCLL